MGTGTSLESLKGQRETVKAGMENSRNMISAAADKVKRLQDASTSMENSIQSLRNIKENIDNFEVVKAKWKGEEEETFTKKYDSYNSSVNEYASDTNKAKKQIDEDLEAARQERAQAETGLENLQNTLAGLEADIRDAKEV